MKNRIYKKKIIKQINKSQIGLEIPIRVSKPGKRVQEILGIDPKVPQSHLGVNLVDSTRSIRLACF